MANKINVNKQTNFQNAQINLQSDMALELLGKDGGIEAANKIKKTKIKVDQKMSKQINRPEGTYITLETGMVTLGLSDKYKELSKAICDSVKELSGKAQSVLVVGLGNPSLTADALGSRVFDGLSVTRHLPDELKRVSLCAVCPNVMGATGIESFDIIKGVCERVKPQLIIAVDSLASAAVGRIGAAFQISSAGITPGSGVNNHRLTLSKETLSAEVISVGVPLVVYAATIIAQSGGDVSQADNHTRNLIVTPKDIDILVGDCGKIIADAINMAFVPEFDGL